MVAIFLDDNKTNDDGDGEENGKKKMFIITNNNFARASRYFGISLPSLHRYDMELPNFTSPLYGVRSHSTIIVTFFF